MNFGERPEVKTDGVAPALEEQERFPDVALRRVTADDFLPLKEHWTKMVTAHPEEYSLTVEDVAQMTEMSYQYALQDPLQIRFLGVDSSGRVLGTIGLEVDEASLALTEGRKGEVKAVAVDPEKRGVKIGERMLEQLIAYAKQVGFSELNLFVRKENMPAKNLYVKYGFVPTGKITDEEGDPNKVMEEYSLAL